MTKTNFDDFAQDYEQLASQPTKRFDSDPSYFARYKVEIMKRVAGRPPQCSSRFWVWYRQGHKPSTLGFF
jgi:hypothetical protein